MNFHFEFQVGIYNSSSNTNFNYTTKLFTLQKIKQLYTKHHIPNPSYTKISHTKISYTKITMSDVRQDFEKHLPAMTSNPLPAAYSTRLAYFTLRNFLIPCLIGSPLIRDPRVRPGSYTTSELNTFCIRSTAAFNSFNSLRQ